MSGGRLRPIMSEAERPLRVVLIPFAALSGNGRNLRKAGQTTSRWSSVLKSPSQRCGSDVRRPLHDDEAGALQVVDKPLGDDLGHDLGGVMDPLAALVAECEGKRRGKVGRVSGSELVGVGHRWTITERSERSKNVRVAIAFVALLLAGAACAQSPDISARRLLSSWKGEDPSMRLLAEVIASAFAGGLSWNGSLAGKGIYCPPQGLKGQQVMSALEKYVGDNPDMAERPYGEAMAASLSRAFPCKAL